MISTAIMAHPRRRSWAEDLGRELDADIVWDRHNDRIETGLRSLQAYDPAASHHLIVQDDAIVCQDLIPALEQAVEVSQDRIVGLYFGKGRAHSTFRLRQIADGADRQKASWIKWPGTIWGVAILVPVARIDELIRAYQRDLLQNYDTRLENAARKRRVGWLYTWPSLVDHRDAPGNPTLAHPDHPEAKKPGRVAYRFIGRDASALEVDWTSGVHYEKR